MATRDYTMLPDEGPYYCALCDADGLCWGVGASADDPDEARAEAASDAAPVFGVPAERLELDPFWITQGQYEWIKIHGGVGWMSEASRMEWSDLSQSERDAWVWGATLTHPGPGWRALDEYTVPPECARVRRVVLGLSPAPHGEVPLTDDMLGQVLTYDPEELHWAQHHASGVGLQAVATEQGAYHVELYLDGAPITSRPVATVGELLACVQVYLHLLPTPSA